MRHTYTLIRSRRRTLALQVCPDLTVRVRAPLRLSQREIDHFVEAHAAWIDTHLEQQRRRAAAHPEPTERERQLLIDRAKAELPAKVALYAARMGLSPTNVRITGAKTRFGSCSAKNSLCFSWRLMQYPEAAIDYVVVHELAHIVHKDHSPAFHVLVASVLPDHRARRKLLRQ